MVAVTTQNSPMSNKILEFTLSHHFMLQGWDRSIDKPMLYKLLPHVEVSKADKKVVVFAPSFYTSKGIEGRANHCLVLVIKQKLLKTGFWCDHPNYLFKTERQADFQWLYK
jgi:hypothetical protein